MALGQSRDLSRDTTVSSSNCISHVELSISSVTILSNCRTFHNVHESPIVLFYLSSTFCTRQQGGLARLICNREV